MQKKKSEINSTYIDLERGAGKERGNQISTPPLPNFRIFDKTQREPLKHANINVYLDNMLYRLKAFKNECTAEARGNVLIKG